MTVASKTRLLALQDAAAQMNATVTLVMCSMYSVCVFCFVSVFNPFTAKSLLVPPLVFFSAAGLVQLVLFIIMLQSQKLGIRAQIFIISTASRWIWIPPSL